MKRSASQTMPINGMEMYFEVSGDGYPLVLLHGFMGSGADWDLVFHSNVEGYKLIIPDLRGHGRSTNPSGLFTYRQAAWDIFDLLDHLQIGTFKAIGLSAGGNILLHMATQQPARIEAMVVVSAAHFFPSAARKFMAEFTVESLGEEDWQALRKRHKHGDDQIRTLYRQGREFRDSYDDMNFTPPFLGRISARTLIVQGDRDPFYPIEIPVEMYKSIPRSSLWIIPSSGHTPIFGKQAGNFAETALDFLTSQS